MKRLIFTMFAAVATTLAAMAGAPVIDFATASHDFGTVNEEGGPVECSFTFTNTGDAPLVIISASAQCGCTQPQHPREPIAPGDSGTISVKYYPKGRPGEFSKIVKVKTNDKEHATVKLKIQGVVVPETKAKK